jgi:hypothetical protein
MIFLSYSGANRQIAYSVENWLQCQGAEVWIDRKDLSLQRDIMPQLSIAISACDLFLAVMSARQRFSRWMCAELEMARIIRRPILYLLAKNAESWRVFHHPMPRLATGDPGATLRHSLTTTNVQVDARYSPVNAAFSIENGQMTLPASEIAVAGGVNGVLARIIAAKNLAFHPGADPATLRDDNWTVAAS